MPNKLKSPILNIKELKGNMRDYILYFCLYSVEGLPEQDKKSRGHKRKERKI